MFANSNLFRWIVRAPRNRPALPKPRSLALAVLIGLAGACLIQPLRAAERIDHIELFQKKSVTIHFDTKPNRTYELQVLTKLTCSGKDNESCSKSGVPKGLWVTLFTAPNLPFPNHYVVTDSRDDRSRFYRLKVTQ